MSSLHLVMPSLALRASISVSMASKVPEASLGSWKDTSAPTLLSRAASLTCDCTRRLMSFTLSSYHEGEISRGNLKGGYPCVFERFNRDNIDSNRLVHDVAQQRRAPPLDVHVRTRQSRVTLNLQQKGKPPVVIHIGLHTYALRKKKRSKHFLSLPSSLIFRSYQDNFNKPCSRWCRIPFLHPPSHYPRHCRRQRRSLPQIP